MKTMSISPLSFGQVYVHEPMNRLQRRKANKLAESMKKVENFDVLDQTGIDVNIKVSPNKGMIFNRNLLAVSFSKGKETDIANFWFKTENERFEKNGKIKEQIERVSYFANMAKDAVDTIAYHENSDVKTKEQIKNIDPEKIVEWQKSRSDSGDGHVMRYYDKEKKCVFDISKGQDRYTGKEWLYCNKSLEGYEYDEEKNAIYSDGFTKDGYKFHKEYLLDSPNNYRNIEYHPNGVVAYDYYLNGENEYENRYDSQGRITRKYSCEYGRYLSDAWFDPETGEVISARSDIL